MKETSYEKEYKVVFLVQMLLWIFHFLVVDKCIKST